MSGYSNDEITAAAAKFVRSDVKVQRDPLGPIDLAAKFGEVRQLISSNLIFDPNSIFYLIYLATNRLNHDVTTIIGWVDDLVQMVQEVSHNTKEVTKTSLLGDASAALLSVDLILTNNGAISNNAYNRYARAIDQFVAASIAPNVKDQAEIIRPPQLARTEAITDLSDISILYTTVLTNLEQVRAELAEFLELNLAAMAAADSVRATRLDVKDLQAFFEGSATNDEKIAACRDAFLRLTVGKTVLQQYTSLKDPSQPRIASSASRLGRASVLNLVSAAITTSRSAPWEVAPTTDSLVLSADGGAPFTLTLIPPEQPSIEGFQVETFNIPGASTLEIDSKTPIIPLTSGVAQTALQVAADINTWAAANYPGQYLATSTGGRVKITKTIGGNQLIKVTGGTILSVLGFYTGQYDTSDAMSAGEVAAAINDDGRLAAEAFFQPFESGTTGGNDTLSRLRVPINTVATTAHGSDQLIITTGPNAGYHRITSIIRSSPYDIINVSEPFTQLVSVQSWRIIREGLSISSVATDLTTELVVGAGTANSLLGITPATIYGQTSGFMATENGKDIDFVAAAVVVGDVLYLGASPYQIASLTSPQLEVTPALSTDLSSTFFSVLSAAALSYQQFVAAMAAWDTRLKASKYEQNINELNRVMNPLLANKNPSLSQQNDALSALSAFRSLLTNASPQGLSEILIGFDVRSSSQMDAALNMLQERGMDRAYDTLMGGRLAEFFAMDMDDVSNSAYVLKTMRAIAQHDLPISKQTLDQDDSAIAQVTEGTDSDYDYSDQDKDETTGILGNSSTTAEDGQSNQRL